MSREVTKEELIIKGGIVAVLLGIGLAAKSCDGKVANDEVSIRIEQTVDNTLNGEREFAPGEHVLSVTMKKPNIGFWDTIDTENTIQIPCQDGYKVVGVSFERDKGCVLYENTDYVYCVPSGKTKDNEYAYCSFGTPRNVDDSYNQTDSKKLFNEGEHVILKPISNPDNDSIQYTQVEGYEIIGIDYATYGRVNSYAGGYIIYRNTVPVECTLEENGYTSFGTPIKVKTKTLAPKNN